MGSEHKFSLSRKNPGKIQLFMSPTYNRHETLHILLGETLLDGGNNA